MILLIILICVILIWGLYDTIIQYYKLNNINKIQQPDNDSLNEWDTRFMNMAYMVSHWSKDPKTKIGCVIAKNKKIKSTGFNGLPSRIIDHNHILNDKELKLKSIVHAELNAILNSNPFDLTGSTIYIYGLPPCINCAKHILSTDISRIIYCYDPLIKHSNKWFDDLNYINDMMNEAGIKFIRMDHNILKELI